MRRDQRRHSQPLPRNTPATGLERATTFFHYTQGARHGGFQWSNGFGSLYDFTNSVGGIIRFG